MVGLPNEILDRIFELACTDDGRTGRALSLVSARVSSISSRHKYFSLRVAGTERIAKFAIFLQHLTPSIQYLVLDYYPLEHAEAMQEYSNFVNRINRGLADTVDMYSVFKRLALAEISIDRWSSIIFSILAPNLKGLHLIHGLVSLDLRPYIFSQLDALYIYGKESRLSLTWTSSSFPSLTFLDISCAHGYYTGEFYPIGYGMLFDKINIPTLTHFGCCSHSSLGSEEILQVLKFTLAYVRKHRRHPPPEANSCLNKLLQLNDLRVRVQDPNLVKALRNFDERVGGLIGWPKNFPRVTAVNHGPIGVGDIPTNEWYHIAEGGEGFKAEEHW